MTHHTRAQAQPRTRSLFVPTLTKTLAALLLAALVLPAAAAADRGGSRFEFNPFFGYRSQGDFERSIGGFDTFDFGVDIEGGESWGINFGFLINRHMAIELMYSTQDTELVDNDFFLDFDFDLDVLLDLEVEYLHAGFVYTWTPGQIEPFVGVSIGATRFLPDLSGLDSVTRPSLSLGGGANIMFSEHFGLRLEARGFFTLIDTDEDLFCNPFSCFEEDVDDTMTQFEGRAGFLFRF